MKIIDRASILITLAILFLLGIEACRSGTGWEGSDASPYTFYMQSPPPPMLPYGETHIPFFLSVVNPSSAPIVGAEFSVERKIETYYWAYVQTVRSDENGWVAFPQMLPLGTYRFANNYTPYPYQVVYGYGGFSVDYAGIPIWQDEPLTIQEGGFTYLTYVLTRNFRL